MGGRGGGHGVRVGISVVRARNPQARQGESVALFQQINTLVSA